MEKIISESMYFYDGTGAQQTYRVLFRMRDTVNGKLLQEAAVQTLKRYPYYAVRCCANEREYYLEPNTEPLEVRHTAEPVNLGSAASNYYLFAISYEGDKIWFNGFHGMTDGAGVLEFMRTLLHYYCREKYDPGLSSRGVRINDGPIPPEEWDNPYIAIMNGDRVMPAEEDILVKSRPPRADGMMQKSFNLFEDARITPSEPVYYHIRISEKELMQYCRTQDGTPGVVISLLMSRAIDRLNPENEAPIVTGVAINLRPALDAAQYKGSPIAMAFLPYSGKIKEKDFSTQATMYRGRLILASDKERLQAGIGRSCQMYRHIDQIPTMEGKFEFVRRILSSMAGTTTFHVSYVGAASLGAAEQYVSEVEMENESHASAIMIEVVAANGYFFLEFVQKWREELYLNAFLDELAGQGISFQVLEKGERKFPKFERP